LGERVKWDSSFLLPSEEKREKERFALIIGEEKRR